MPAAGRAPFAHAVRSLGVAADAVRAPDDLDGVRLPQAEGVDRSGRPFAARAAMAIAHRHRLARHLDRDVAAKALAVIGLLARHVHLLVPPSPCGASYPSVGGI